MKCKMALKTRTQNMAQMVVSNRRGMLIATSANRKDNRNNIVQELNV